MTSRVEAYTVGWICAITTEYVIAIELLDEEYPKHQTPYVDPSQDHNSYTFGRIHDHHIVIACLPKGRYGIASAARVAKDMLRTFPAIRFGLMVGIGGGAPSAHNDIRLGDVVVSIPGSGRGGVINYDFGKAIQDRAFEATGYLSPPPAILLTAISQLESLHKRKGHRIEQTLNQVLANNKRLRKTYSRPNEDKLYQSSYVHKAEGFCDCQKAGLTNSSFLTLREERDPDEDDPVIWYGLIASADKLMKHALLRDEITANHNVLCFEMEAAGLMDDFPCIVIRGICDYSDSHKNDTWQGWAAATAAAYAKELLGVILGTGHQDIHVTNPKNDSQAQNIQNTIGPFENLSLEDTIQKQGQQQATAQGQHFYEHSEFDKHQLEVCHQVFRLLPPYEDQLFRTSLRAENTCAWVFGHHQFLSWKAADCDAVLWISASPGSGKSVLSRAIVEERIVERADVMCYFFFKDVSVYQRSISSALAAILHQLFTQKPELIKYALPGYRANGKALPDLFDVMWTILEQASMDPNTGTVICVLDALDECEEAELPTLIMKLRNLCFLQTQARDQIQPQGARVFSRLKILVTSRPYSYIGQQFRTMVQSLPSIHLAGDQESANIEQEINLVIEKEIANLAAEKGLSSHAQTKLRTKLQGTNNWSYLWLDLVLREIRENEYVNSSEIEDFFSSLPVSVTGAYSKILNRCRDQVLARQVFQLVLAAVKPLEIEELNVALALVRNTAARSYQDLDLSSNEHFATRMRNACGLFLQIFDNRVYLYHQTAREYLLQDETHEQHSHDWQHSFNLTESHQLMLETCISLLKFDIFEDSPPPKDLRATDRSWPSWDIENTPYFQSLIKTEQKTISRLWRQQKESKVERTFDLIELEEQQLAWATSIWIYARSHHFLTYAAISWTSHYESACKSEIDISKLVTIFVTPGINEPQPRGRLWTWWSIYRIRDWGKLPDIAPPLVLSAWMGNSDLIRRMLFYGLSLEESDSDGHTALSRAARGHVDLVNRTISERLEASKILLEHGANPNPPMPCTRWHFEIDDTGSRTEIQRSVGSLLAQLLNEEEYSLCNILHEYGISLEGAATDKGMPLIHYCTILGFLDSRYILMNRLHWLLKKGVNASSYFASITPLHRVTTNAVLEAIQLLLDYGAYINEATRGEVNFYNPPGLELFINDEPSSFNKRSTVRMAAGNTALHIGVAHYVISCIYHMQRSDGQAIDSVEFLKLVELLLVHGADVNHENELGMTPLNELYDQLFKSLETLIELHWLVENSSVSQTSTSCSTEYADSVVSSSSIDYDDETSNEVDVSSKHISEEEMEDFNMQIPAVMTTGKETKATTMALTLYDPSAHLSLLIDSGVDEFSEEYYDVKRVFMNNVSEQTSWAELPTRLSNREDLRPEFVMSCTAGDPDLVQMHEAFENFIMTTAEPMESLLQRYGAKTGSGPSIRAHLISW